MSDGGKGSKPRPLSVAQQEYDQRWDLIFGREKGQKERDKEFDKRQDALDRLAEENKRLGLSIDNKENV